MKNLCIYFASLLVLLLSLSSCRTGCYLSDQQLPEIIIHDTVRVHQLNRDSIFLHDSISHLEKGDTIYEYRFRTLHHYKTLYRDSIVIRRDTIPVTITVEKLTPYTPAYMKFFAYVGITLIISFIIYVIIKLKF